jgi:hypothetical protein
MLQQDNYGFWRNMLSVISYGLIDGQNWFEKQLNIKFKVSHRSERKYLHYLQPVDFGNAEEVDNDSSREVA